MTDTTAPRCPACGAPMQICGVNKWYCYKDRIGTIQPTPTNRVLCPACKGEKTKGLVPGKGWVETEEIVFCLVCRRRGTVPPALAAAWLADEQASGGEG